MKAYNPAFYNFLILKPAKFERIVTTYEYIECLELDYSF